MNPHGCHPAERTAIAGFPLCGDMSEFFLSFGHDGGPEASSCPAVLGDVNPCWGVYECVTFTWFALMYITMSKYSKFILNIERRVDYKSNQCIVIILSISMILLQHKQICFELFFCHFVCLLEPCSLPSLALLSYES